MSRLGRTSTKGNVNRNHHCTWHDFQGTKPPGMLANKGQKKKRIEEQTNEKGVFFLRRNGTHGSKQPTIIGWEQMNSQANPPLPRKKRPKLVVHLISRHETKALPLSGQACQKNHNFQYRSMMDVSSSLAISSFLKVDTLHKNKTIFDQHIFLPLPSSLEGKMSN